MFPWPPARGFCRWEEGNELTISPSNTTFFIAQSLRGPGREEDWRMRDKERQKSSHLTGIDAMSCLHHMVTLFLTFEERPDFLLWWVWYFIFSSAMYKDSNFSLSSPMLIIWLFYYNHPNGCEMVSHYDFTFHFFDD